MSFTVTEKYPLECAFVNHFYFYSISTKGYWMRNNQNGGCEWNGNLYNINKIQYLSTAWSSYPLLVVTT